MNLQPKAQNVIQPGKRSLRKRIYEFRYLYLMLSFALIYFIVFKYVPMYGVQLAFKKFSYRKGILGSNWIGWTISKPCLPTNNLFVLSAIRWPLVWAV